jgi:hypothetical protein
MEDHCEDPPSIAEIKANWLAVFDMRKATLTERVGCCVFECDAMAWIIFYF